MMDVWYKYLPHSSQALRNLKNRHVYFASSEKLNDPYDCRISIRQALSDAVSKASSVENPKLRDNLLRLKKLKNVYEKIENDVSKAGVLSLTKDPKNVVMWEHYTKGHSGFCLGFEFSSKFTTHENNEQIVGACDVQYAKSNPFLERFEEMARTGELPTWDLFWVELMSIGMTAKAEAWKYEDEVRVLRRVSGVVSFAPSELVEVVFGMNMPHKKRSKIIKLLTGDEWKHVRFKEVVRKEGFEVGIEDIAG